MIYVRPKKKNFKWVSLQKTLFFVKQTSGQNKNDSKELPIDTFNTLRIHLFLRREQQKVSCLGPRGIGQEDFSQK